MRPTTISQQLIDLLGQVEKAPAVSAAMKKNMVLFIDRVVEVVEQAFREVLRLSTELKYIQDSELTPDGIRRYQMKAESLRQRDRYRDVEFICGRLHVLRTQFHEEGFDTLTQGFDSSFRELIHLIDERESELVELANSFLHFVYGSLNNVQRNVHDISTARQLCDEMAIAISERVPELQQSLHDLNGIHDRILPTIGGAGLVEILSGRPAAPSVSIDASSQIHVGGDLVHGSQRKAGGDFFEAGGDIRIAESLEPGTLHEARKTLLDAIQGFPGDRRALIEKQIDEVVDAINRKAAPSEIQTKAKALEMFLESGKALFSAPAKAAWKVMKRLAGSNPA